MNITPTRRMITVGAMVATAVLAGCGTRVGATKSGPGYYVGSTRTAVACIDVSGSVPPTVFHYTSSLVAHELLRDPVPGAGRFVLYIRRFARVGIGPDSNLMIVEVPPVPKFIEPYPTSNPFLPNADLTATMTTYDRAKALALTPEAVARATAVSAATAIAHLHPKVDNTGTDLTACPAAASRLFPSKGQLYLTVSSDLVPSGVQQEHLHVSLSSVRVVIIQYCAGQSQQFYICQQNISRFVNILKKAHIAQVMLCDYTQMIKSGLIQGIFTPEGPDECKRVV